MTIDDDPLARREREALAVYAERRARGDRLAAFRREGKTLREVGAIEGISVERVRQLLIDAGYDGYGHRKGTTAICVFCGVTYEPTAILERIAVRRYWPYSHCSIRCAHDDEKAKARRLTARSSSHAGGS